MAALVVMGFIFILVVVLLRTGTLRWPDPPWMRERSVEEVRRNWTAAEDGRKERRWNVLPDGVDPSIREYVAVLRESAELISDPSKAKVFLSSGGLKVGAPPVPLAVFGYDAEGTAADFARRTPINTVAITDLGALEELVEAQDFVGVIALAKDEDGEDAARAIRIASEKAFVRTATIYENRHSDVERAIERAVDCGADGVLTCGLTGDDRITYLCGVIGMFGEGHAAPATVEEHKHRISNLLRRPE